jgi:hypothetical protein
MKKKFVTPVSRALGLALGIGALVYSKGVAGADTSSTFFESPTSASTTTAATSQSADELRTLLRQHSSTNNDQVIASALAGQLIAEQLRTNRAFLMWATNTARNSISRLLGAKLPIYGVTNISPDDIRIDAVTAMARTGVRAECSYGSLYIVVEGGTNPIVTMVKDPYHLADYLLDLPRGREPKEWSQAQSPLDKDQVDRMARAAFMVMTGRDLDSFNVQATIKTPEVLNRNVEHPEVKVTGVPGAKLISRHDNVYPFAFFSYSPPSSSYRPFSGELMQTKPGSGEFVRLFAPVGTPDAVFALAEKFLGSQSGLWEQSLLSEVRSMPEKEQAEVYRRMFAH